MGITIKELNEWFIELDRQYRPPKELIIPMGMQQKIMWDVSCMKEFHKIPGRMFYTDTKKAHDYIEITPYNKGNLWKIRCFFNYFHIYHGTIRKAYCSTFIDAINFIPKPLQP